jgi:hypothetical protein
MKRYSVAPLVLCAAIGASCSSSHKATTVEPAKTDSVKVTVPFRFSFYISGSGGGSKPQDSWTIDTAGMMAVKTLIPTSPGNWNTVNALAELDPPDRDSLVGMIRTGKLWTIDSADIDQQCAGDEIFAIVIAPLSESRQFHATFQSCAQDYNLLLEPQRTQFKRLMSWFERMRVKYRPSQP